VIDIGARLNQRFLLERELGRGGMGAVYSALDELLERKVAIKVLRERSGEDVGKKLRLEAQIAARLLNENVVRIYDFGQADGTYYLVMEEVTGTSYAKRWRQLPLEERLRILASVADALDYAHHQGVIHRDVKPGNVLLTANDVPKLSDFGLSTISAQEDRTRTIRGTPHYMSPEQARGHKLDHRTDLYSLGVMIYESATGSVPFSGTSTSIMNQQASAQPERPRIRNPSLAESLEGLIMELLAKQVENRPASGALVAQAMRQEIDQILERARQSANVSSGSAVSAVELAAPTSPSLRAAESETAELRTSGAQAIAPPVSVAELAARAGQWSVPVSDGAAAASASRGAIAAAPGAAAGFRVVATVAGTGGVTALVGSPLVRKILECVLAEPVLLSPDERYLQGHYLAYLLSGSRRRGLLLRRPLEPRNADRARLLLGVTYALLSGGTDEAIGEAASLLDQRIEVRPALSPVVVAKYLACRETAGKRKAFRKARRAIAEASAHAQKRMIDERGVLNPGLMPQKLDDLRLVAPARTEVDDVLVERWNRVADVWRDQPQFRNAVLRYATVKAHRDPVSVTLWPEVVYPLIERARWHRRIRTRTETVWDYIWGRMLHLPDAGVVLDRALSKAVPAPLVAQLDDSLDLLVESPRLDDEEGDPFAERDEADRLTASLGEQQISLEELAAEPVEDEREKGIVRLIEPWPLRFTQRELHELWREALTALQTQTQTQPRGPAAGHRHVPIGPYRLIVIPSIRGRAAGQVAIQGMSNKQIELTTPTVRTKGSGGKPFIAIWVYSDNSLVICHLDFKSTCRYILWHAPKSHQLNFDEPGDLNHELYGLGMEIPDHIDKALSRWFKPGK
jgi:serine/threonine-protein kinase